MIKSVSTWYAVLTVGIGISCSAFAREETFTPYQVEDVPDNVVDLWKGYDPRQEDLEVKVIKEWKEEGVVTRYVTFKVGTFKGADSRIAAYYSFPDNGSKSPGCVWSHGGGQRAERGRGVYLAKQGFATVDINWLGREMEPGITENTDWGNVDPTQGPRFYSKALRKSWKRGVQPDEHTIDPVPSPRNNNWFLLVVAARRGITFLEQQPEVLADRIGLSGFSMGGTITAMAAIDPRVKAAVPFVGGTGFLHVDFPGSPGTSLKGHFTGHLDLYETAIDPAAYWPLVRCPVMFISSSNDFHAAFDRIYQSMALLKHQAWRVSANMHENHRPGPEQWVLLNRWFNLHLKRVDQQIPATPPSRLVVNGQEATFTVTPEDRHSLVDTEIYYSYDPNACTRFWIRAEASKDAAGRSWTATMPVYKKLPFYAFALCRYSLGENVPLRHGSTSTLTVNSLEQSLVPEKIDLKELAKLANGNLVFEDFEKGFQDWSVREGGRDLFTFKFQSPLVDLSNRNKLCFTMNPQGRKLSLRIGANSRFLGSGKDLGSFSLGKTIDGEDLQEVVIGRKEFKSKTDGTLEWSKIANFSLSIVDVATKEQVDLTSEEGRAVLQAIRLVN